MAFHRVIEILDQAIGGPDVGVGRHGAFWRGITRDEFVAKKVLVKATRSVYSSTGFGSSATSRSATRQERPVYKYSAEPTPAPLEASAVGELELLADNAPMDTELPLRLPANIPAEAGQMYVDIWSRFAKHVRRLIDEKQPQTGTRTLEWDGIDDDGEPVQPGAYIVRITSTAIPKAK